jgi:hypothetical protein
MNKIALFIIFLCFIVFAQNSDSVRVQLRKLSLKELNKIEKTNKQLIANIQDEISRIIDEIDSSVIDSLCNGLSKLIEEVYNVTFIATVTSPCYLYFEPDYKKHYDDKIGELNFKEKLNCKGLIKDFVLLERNNKNYFAYRGNLAFKDTCQDVINKYESYIKSINGLKQNLKAIKNNGIGLDFDTTILTSRADKEKIIQLCTKIARTDSLEKIKSELDLKNEIVLEVIPEVERKDSLFAKYKKTIFINTIINKKVKIGMTKNMVLDSWGEPDDINRSVGSWGVHEQWVYGENYLYFENGKLTSFQD